MVRPRLAGVSARRLHLVRHGEVFNPERVLYGRIPGYRLSVEGRRMARAAAEHIQSLQRPIGALISSPLQRAKESSQPFTELFGLTPVIDERIIEPTNIFEGKRVKRAVLNPLVWPKLLRPSVPSWGEPYESIATRVIAAMNDVWDDTESGDIVMVSHQSPIWITHLKIAGEPMKHKSWNRRCNLSSVTSFERDENGTWREVAYAEPAETGDAVDVGAV